MSDFHNEKFPVGVLYAAGGMIGITLAVVFSLQTGLIDHRPTAPQARAIAKVAAVKTRNFRFQDRKDGALVAYDADSNAEAMVLEPGSNSGFIRGVMRGMMRERMLKEQPHNGPVKVTEWSDGALTLTDPSTGRIIELGSFGPTNRASFAALLAGEKTVIVKTDPKNANGGFFGAAS